MREIDPLKQTPDCELDRDNRINWRQMQKDTHDAFKQEATLRSIIDTMAQQAQDQTDRAYRILGAKPGPGTDLLIYPVQPVCGKWLVSGLTDAGRNFVQKFWPAPIESNRELTRLKHEAQDWQLKYRIEYPIVSMED